MSEEKSETFKILEQADKEYDFLIQKTGNLLQRAKISNLLGDEIYFKLSIGRRSYCGKTKIEQVKNAVYKFTIPERIFIFDRRQNIRLRSTNAMSVRAKYLDQKFEVFNISAKSLSMRVNESDLKNFSMETLHKNLKVAINQSVFTVPYFRVISSRAITGPNPRANQLLYNNLPFS